MLRLCETGAPARPCRPVAGLNQCARRRSQVSNRASPTIRYSQPTGQGGVGPLPLPGAKVFRLCDAASIPRQLKASRFRRRMAESFTFAQIRQSGSDLGPISQPKSSFEFP